MARLRLITGFHAVTSRLRQNPKSIKEIYLDSGRDDVRMRHLAAVAQARQVRIMRIERNRLDGMAAHSRHQGVVATIDAATAAPDLEQMFSNLRESALLLVLDEVQDPHNLGACLRVADAFGAHAVIAPKDRACALTEAAAKVASGAAETVPYVMVSNLARTLRQLKERGIWILGAAQDAAEDITAIRLDGPLAWVLGAEGKGLRRLTREHCDCLVRIPMLGAVESLNVSVAGAICLYETRRHRARDRGQTV
jgi:23S rRNA (guanosine2251-2'-O)-methyltransferase